MCGFLGMVGQGTNDEVDILLKGELIHHRGPDDTGYYFDEHVKLVFKRLSIIDLEGGHQPLSYDDQRYWIVFNGEIYNYVELRKDLKERGYEFQTNSDTETILALYSYKGAELVNDLRGMFAFVIWDREKQELFGARDHFGIKPFFYMEEEEALYFSSEAKTLINMKMNNKVDLQSLQHYFTYQYSPEPSSMSEGIKKVEPGTYFTKKVNEKINITSYWKPSFQINRESLDTKKKKIIDALRDSVKVHMRSDVPVGAFLSGGIDSTAIVALAKEINPQIKTFTVGFECNGYSEIEVAKETAAVLGVENIDYVITPEEYGKQLPKIIWHMDDPLADPAAVPLYFVAREARKHVKVVLSGEGADELFGGYNIYREPQSLHGFTYLSDKTKQFLKKMMVKIPDGVRGKSFIERGCTPIEQRYLGNAKIFTEHEKANFLKQYDGNIDFTKVTAPIYDLAKNYTDIEKMQLVDMYTWLRGDILVKADKMTMANSLELRVPFLDKEVFNIASTLSEEEKVTKYTTKLALREAMREIVPEHVLMRRKLGFPVPIRHWLKNELYEWAVKLIDESGTDYLIDKRYVYNLLNAHCIGKGDYSRKLWTILIFMIWHQIFIETAYPLAKELDEVVHLS